MAVVVLLAGCAGPEARQAGPAGAPTPTGLTAEQEAMAPAGPTLGAQHQGDVLAWLSSNPTQPVRGGAEMDAYLVGTTGQPITDARVTFDTDMTNMSHGEYLVAAEPAGEGHYVGKVHFLMAGPWRVIAIVERPGQATMKLRFEFTVQSK